MLFYPLTNKPTTMRRLLTISVLVFASIGMLNAQVLYKISGKGLDEPSYLLGTMHFASYDFTHDIAGYDRVFSSVEQICGEVAHDNLQAAIVEYVLKHPNLLKQPKLPKGTTFFDLFSEEELAEIDNRLYKVLGTNLTDSETRSKVSKMTPQEFQGTLTIAKFGDIVDPIQPNDQIDVAIQAVAKDAGKRVIGLESVEEQLNIILPAKSQPTIEQQKEVLLEELRLWDQKFELLETLIDSYMEQNYKPIANIVEDETLAELGFSTNTTTFDDVITQRNIRWMQRIPEVIDNRPTLIVVGIAHLPGEQGIINLLKRSGYKVKAVKR